MITLYYMPSPNTRKVSIALEEMGLPYRLRTVDIFNREAQTPEYLAICPNGRVPAMIDEEPDREVVRIFESGAILQYLGRKSDLFYPRESEARRAWIDAWVFWQMAGLGPMSGQITWFLRAAEKPGRDPGEISLPLHRYRKETARLYQVLERQLAGRDFVCNDYSIADMACWPWVDQYGARDFGELTEFPAIKAWHARISQRPAVARAMALGMDTVKPPTAESR